jgi:hypothetical protein
VEPGGQLFCSEDEARVTVLHIIPAHHSLTVLLSGWSLAASSSVARMRPESLSST